jgi:hypothetical protein
MAQGGRPPPGGWGVICQPGPGCHKIAKHAVLVLSEWPAARGKRNSEGNKLNAVEIEEATSALAEQPFDAQEFPFAFLQAFPRRAHWRAFGAAGFWVGPSALAHAARAGRLARLWCAIAALRVDAKALPLDASAIDTPPKDTAELRQVTVLL